MWSIRKTDILDVPVLTDLRLRFLEEIAYDGDLTASVVRDHLDRALPAGQFHAWVAEQDAQIVATSGLVLLHKPPHGRNLSGTEGFVLNMYTLPAHRGRGICTALMETIIRYVRRIGVTCIRLHASEGGLGIYSKLGFQADNSEMFLYLPQSSLQEQEC